MGLGASLGLSHTSGKTTENSTSTTTKNTPEWMTGAWQDIFANAGLLGDTDPTSFFAGPSDLQTKAFAAAPNLGAGSSALLGDAAGYAKAGASAGPYSYNPAEMSAATIGDPSTVTGATAYGGIANYVNPFEGQVVQNTLTDLNKARAMEETGNGRGAIGAGQYGGSRQGVLDRTARDSFERNVGATSGALRSQGFTTALGAADADANRAQSADTFNAAAKNQVGLSQAQLDQQAAGANQDAKNTAWSANARAGDTAAARQLQGGALLGNLGESTGTQERANLGLLGDLGGVQQGLDQAKAGAPLSLAQLLAQIYGSAPTDAFVGSTTNASGTTKSKGTTISGSLKAG